MQLKDAIENTKKIYMNDSSLAMLLDFERVLDELDLYVFEHWIDGELVQGPEIKRHWITCTFMWPRAQMPNPRGAARLIPYGCKVFYKKSQIKIPVKIKSPDDFRPGTRKAKLETVPVWLVSIRMPQELVGDIESGSLEIASEDYDMEDIQQSYQLGVESQTSTQNGLENNTQNEQPIDLLGGF